MRKLAFVAGVAIGAMVSLSSATARADVYSKASYWFRGMGVDANGNGILDSGELRDALNLHGTESHDNGSCATVFTNETVNMPYRGVSRQMQCLYLPQTVTVTNDEAQLGYMNPNTFRLPAYAVQAITNRTRFAFAIRYRPDLTRPHKDYAWILNAGNNGSAKRGFMVGLGPTGNDVRTIDNNKTFFTNKLANVMFIYGGASFYVNNGGSKAGMGTWNDLVVSVDGRKVSFLMSRYGNIWDTKSCSSNSASANWSTTFITHTLNEGYDASPRQDATMAMGGEAYRSAQVGWLGINPSAQYNDIKTFRGSIQSFAVWSNALTEAEMREAAAWPRTDLWRVGVENDATTEFNGSGTMATVDVDEDRWNVPAALPSGGKVTFRFPLDTYGEAAMPQVFRIKPTSNSGSGTVCVTVNGTLLDTRLVAPGQTARWFVPETLLVAGTTNVLELARTDSGSVPVKIDSAVFGGSLQYGKRDGSLYDFGWEGHYQDNANYWLVGANWYDGCRALFGTGTDSNGKSTVHTNTLIHFSVPAEILAHYDWRMKFRTFGTGTVNMELNGTNLGTWSSNTTQDNIVIPDGVVQSENVLRFSNVRPYVSGVYMSPDYISLYLVDRPNGTMLLIK